MSTLELSTGRIAQKLKTRESLILKANELLKNGLLLSIDQVAKEAGISKASAYRYFTNLESLKREASLHLKTEKAVDIFAGISNDDLKSRLERLIDYHYNLFIENETELRLYLSSILNDSVISKTINLRGGRRIAIIIEALEPLRNSKTKSEFTYMVNALSLVFGIESITILKDLCGLNNEAIIKNWRWLVYRIVDI